MSVKKKSLVGWIEKGSFDMLITDIKDSVYLGVDMTDPFTNLTKVRITIEEVK